MTTKGPWGITSQPIHGQKMYTLYRLLDVEGVDHHENREYFGGYVLTREILLPLLDRLTPRGGQDSEAPQGASPGERRGKEHPAYRWNISYQMINNQKMYTAYRKRPDGTQEDLGWYTIYREHLIARVEEISSWND